MMPLMPKQAVARIVFQQWMQSHLITAIAHLCVVHLQGQYSPSLGNFEYIVQPNLDEDFTWSDCPFKCPAPFHGSQSGDVTNSVPCLPEELQESEDFGCCTQDNSKIYPACKSWPGPGEGRRRSKYSLAGAEQLDSTCSGPCPKVRCRSKLVAPCGA
jgi:hypothetical protein